MQSPFSNTNAFGARSTDARFGFQNYIIKRKALQMFGATLYLYGPDEQMIMWGQRQAFKLKSELTLFSDDTQSQAIIRLVPRTILDMSAAYDVYDAITGQKVGVFKRKGLTSMLVQDTWTIMDTQDREVGQVQEDSALLGFIRRYVENAAILFPQKFHATLNGVPVAVYARHKNFFTSRMDIDFSADTNALFDRRLGLAMAMLLEAVEHKGR